jgi:hypothetical protein
VETSIFYLKENETRAFINPSFKVENLKDVDVDTVLAGRYTLTDLTALFDTSKKPHPSPISDQGFLRQEDSVEGLSAPDASPSLAI